ncbi:hypothetical protein EBU95_19830, partial [bacterium]|nr:hypothetical protein [bacterium]
MEDAMKKTIIGLLLSVLINQLNGAALARRVATYAARIPVTSSNMFSNPEKRFHSYRDIAGTLSALPEDKQDVSPLHGAVAIASGDLRNWQQQEDKKELFKALFHERDNIIYPTVAIGNPTSSLEPHMLGTFISMACAPSFTLDTFLTSDFVKEWHAVHFKKTGRYEQFPDFKKQVKKITTALIAADKTDQATALAAATCLKFPTREALKKVFESYPGTNFSQFQVPERFNDETLLQAQELLREQEEDREYTLPELEKITFLALESTRKGKNAHLSVPFQHANYKSRSINPCVEVALRTFINTILIDPQTQLLSIDALPQGITLNPEFKAFIEKHKNLSIQDYYTKTKDAWMALASGKSTIQYLQGDTEMKGEMHNSLAFLNHCFGTRATTLAEFGKLLSTDIKQIIIDKKNETYGNYTISIKTSGQNFNGQWSFSVGHVKYSLKETTTINFSLMDLLRLSKIKKGGVSLLNLVSKNQQRSIFEESINRNLSNESWTFDVLKKTCKILDLDLANFSFEDQSNFLHKAAIHNRLDLIEPLVGAEINLEKINHLGETPLLAAIRHHNIAIIEALVRLGANVNQQSRRGETPIHLVTEERGSIPILKALIRLGANINQKNHSDETPLVAAIRHHNIAIVEELVRSGANINQKNKWGIPLLHTVIARKKMSMFEALIRLGANINEKSE